jgi:hypothetical protein
VAVSGLSCRASKLHTFCSEALVSRTTLFVVDTTINVVRADAPARVTRAPAEPLLGYGTDSSETGPFAIKVSQCLGFEGGNDPGNEVSHLLKRL